MQNHSAPIYVIGSINTDLVVRTPTLPRPGETVMGSDFVVTAGGKGANQAVAASRLGGAVSLVARLGTDAFGHGGQFSLAHKVREKRGLGLRVPGGVLAFAVVHRHVQTHGVLGIDLRLARFLGSS